MLSRRDVLKAAGQTALAAGVSPLMTTIQSSGDKGGIRCINVVNFIREIEPRFKMDMMLPITSQMEIILKHKLPATWLLQFDALVSGPFVPYLKEHMAKDHEVGFWFEMNEKHVKAAGVEWRGRPGYEWDHLPPVAFTIGYTHDERIKLADTAMTQFKEIWGHYPKSIASWNLDSFTMGHLSEKYGVDAYAVCRDQIATDGFTIWGSPIAGYYPSKVNCWSPALDAKNQINTPMLRMLGQDPVYYYERSFKIPSGRTISEPDTMEPAWTSGRSLHFIREFLRMIESEPTLQFGYCQMGQENTFPWDQQKEGYPIQMEALAALRKAGKVHVETMGETGRRFKKAFKTTPTQAQVQLVDPFENTNPAQGSIWYQSRFYRANLHIKGDLAYFRDLTVYSDKYAQPFLDKATRLNDVDQKMPPVLDGYHWRGKTLDDSEPGAGGFFELGGQRLKLTGKPVIEEEAKSLWVRLPVSNDHTILIRFDEKQVSFTLAVNQVPFDNLGGNKGPFALAFVWDPEKANLIDIQPKRAHFRSREFDYFVDVVSGLAMKTNQGWSVLQDKDLVLRLAQPS